ncbi:two-component system sensor histidine kinase NtrB [Bacillus massilinigeriensis]|uniref:two-component system sensor histidine kinase NtrB n=1 Tax=Bacillus mediterraneensis TaxID=1805474 RepID=UPI0008F83FE0|nr:ATP-binding protein [Bacillus mediterraneensis]
MNKNKFSPVDDNDFTRKSSFLLHQSVSQIAHEIRNPLTAIRGFVQLLKPDLIALGKEKHAELLLQEIDRTNELIDEYLGIRRQERSGYEKQSLHLLIADISFLFESEAILRNIQFSADFSDEEIFILCEKGQIRQVLFNLVRNAFEAVEAKGSSCGKVRMKVAKKGGFARITVIDNGIGLSKEESVSMVTNSHYTTKERGSGIGLSVSKNIVDSHGGKLEISSKLGYGTIVTVQIPLLF